MNKVEIKKSLIEIHSLLKDRKYKRATENLGITIYCIENETNNEIKQPYLNGADLRCPKQNLKK